MATNGYPTNEERTLDYQSKLPAFPLPSLEQTCEKYLRSVRPFLNEEEYIETETQTNLFLNGVGKELQEKLEKLAESSRNWVQEWWLNGYMDYRGPTPVLSNPGGGVESLHTCDQAKHGSQYERSSLWLYFMMARFQESLRQEVPVQRLGRRHLMDMTQYYDFFCGGRIPGEHRDRRVHYMHTIPKKDGTMEVVCNIKHVVVLMKGRIFKLDLFDKDGIILLPPVIERQLLKMAAMCKEDGDGIAIGSLTAANRPTWHKAYQHLCVLDRQNKINIDLINEAIVALAIDDVETFDLQTSMEHCVLGECTNRWFDKSFCGICSSTGLIGSTNDHSHYDGNVGCSIMKHIWDDILALECTWKGEDDLRPIDDPIELQFTVDDEILDNIKEAQLKHQTLVSMFEIIDRPIVGFAKNYAKSVRVNPDTLLQMAIQLAYYKLHNKCVATYESGTARVFYHGRTETVRSCTCETKAWVESMCDGNAEKSVKKDLFLKAAKDHDRLMVDACSGGGIDRHFYALKKVAENEEIPTPSIFTDKAWKLSGGDSNFIISSSLSGFHLIHGTIGPMCYDGYGIFYNIDEARVYITVSTFKDCADTNCPQLYEGIINALHLIKDLLVDQAKL